MFNTLLDLIAKCAKDNFTSATKRLDEFISSAENFMDILTQIGTIPESLAHDSTEEKLFAKVSDSVLARAFRELGLKSTVLSERADSADVIAKSDIHGYSLVADAKAFRLSRTAKNQKDFKVGALSSWRADADYAVLCSPYFQYPRTQSQIYAQAIDTNVCLLSWEHMIFLLCYGIKEDTAINLSSLWNFGNAIAQTTVVADKKRCFVREFDQCCISTSDLSQSDFNQLLASCAARIKNRGEQEKAYWEAECKAIQAYSRKQAIEELIKSKKIKEKIRQIDLYIRGIKID